MKFFKPKDFAKPYSMLVPVEMTQPEVMATLANAKLELELGNEFAIVNHFKGENETLSAYSKISDEIAVDYCRQIAALRTANQRLRMIFDSINPYDIICIAEKHVIGVVGGGSIDFDTCQDAIQSYLDAKADQP